MSRVAAYLDSDRLVTLLDQDEEGHRSAVFSIRLELDAGSPLMTSNYAVVKAALELQRRHGVEGARRLLEELVPFMHVEWCTRTDHRAAVAALLVQGRASDKCHPDLVDCLAQQVMRRTGARPMF
jgi:predicted nucleic acid-binding protein